MPSAVSVLFSEPKIPQYPALARWRCARRVSVLFSEPKIPQLVLFPIRRQQQRRFSALQRAENSSIGILHRLPHFVVAFQCSSASRKFLNSARR